MKICGVCDGWDSTYVVADGHIHGNVSWTDTAARVNERGQLLETSVTSSNCWKKWDRHWLLKHCWGRVGYVCNWWQRREDKRDWHGEVKVEERFEFGCGKQNRWYKGREKHLSPTGRKVRIKPVVPKKNVVAAGKEGKVTKCRTWFCSGVGNGQ